MKEFKNLFISLNYNIKKYHLKVFDNINNWSETIDLMSKLVQTLTEELQKSKHTNQEIKGLLNCLNLIRTIQKGTDDN